MSLLSLFNNAQKIIDSLGHPQASKCVVFKDWIFSNPGPPVLVVVGSSLSSNDQGSSLIPDFKLSPLSSFLVPNPIKYVGPGFVTHRANWLILSIDTFPLSLSRIQLVIGKE